MRHAHKATSPDFSIPNQLQTILVALDIKMKYAMALVAPHIAFSFFDAPFK
jgi:hypothetical protein